MKVGPVEGTPEEVHDFFQNNGLNPFDYFEKPDPKLKIIWIAIPSLLLATFSGGLIFWDGASEKTRLAIFLAGFAASVWLALSINIRFKNSWAAGAAILSGILIMLVSLGVLQPEQIVNHYGNSK